jgi:hypothetical protein
MNQVCRAAADKRVVGIDGQHSTLLSVLYQTPHGGKRDKSKEEPTDGSHVMLSVTCYDSVLLTKAAPSEFFTWQFEALKEAVGEGGAEDVLILLSDDPIALDKAPLFEHFVNATCVAKDPIHVALKIELASGEKVTAFSLLLRRCLQKFRCGVEDRKPYHRSGHPTPRSVSLATAMSSMTTQKAAAKVKGINNDGYETIPYRSADSFVQDVAAIAKSYPEELGRRINKKTTVLSSLAYATSGDALQYLMNNSRFVARNPEVPFSYGTTRNEAYHKELLAFYRNVFQQTERHARDVAMVATSTKLLAGYLAKCELTAAHRQEVLLRTASSLLSSSDHACFPQLMDHLAVKNTVVDIGLLPHSAKTSRKRPAAEEVAYTRKKPAHRIRR